MGGPHIICLNQDFDCICYLRQELFMLQHKVMLLLYWFSTHFFNFHSANRYNVTTAAIHCDKVQLKATHATHTAHATHTTIM